MPKSRTFLFFCISFIAGIFIASEIDIPRLLQLGFFILGIITASVFWLNQKIAVGAFCLIIFSLAILNYQIAESGFKNDLKILESTGEKIEIYGVVSDEPVKKEKYSQFVIDAQSLIVGKKELRPSNKILVQTSKYPEYEYGDKLIVSGNLSVAPQLEGFNYQNYLKKDRIFAISSFPKIELVKKGEGNFIKKNLINLKNKFQGGCERFIPPPQIGLLEALFSGDESNISGDWKQKYNIAGIRHITAVSGMNITIIGFLILSVALGFGMWRGKAFYLSLFLIALYILMIGAPASGVRAGIMAGFLMTAQYFGRLAQMFRLVVFAAVLMLVFNPFLLVLDIGFQLSFLAVLGLVYFQPAFSAWLKKVPNPKIFPIRDTVSATLGAQVFTLPILVYNFGRISLFSTIANILIVPVLAPLTILIFVFGLAVMVFGILGYILYIPVWISLSYVTLVADFFYRLPMASLEIKNVHWIWPAVFYLIIVFIARRLSQKQKSKFLQY